MAINLEKNRAQLKAAWLDVLDDKTNTNWALFGYEGQTNDLRVVSKGSDGTEEMIEDLKSSQIMYAFVKVNDPKTTLPKCVLINWQGEGANIVRKGTCANHLRDVANFFTGAHVTMNARNEEEVEPQIIIDKVEKSSGSAYSFKTNRSEVIDVQKPVGTNYQRVNPVKEINAQERNQFWIREEEEERKRIDEERKRKEIEKVRLEEELKRQLAEALEREEDAPKEPVSPKKAGQKLEADRLTRSIFEEDEAKINQSELLRKQRNEEAQQLIGKRTTAARSIFEQNTSAGQMFNSPIKRNSNGKIDTSLFENNSNHVELPKSPVKKVVAPKENIVEPDNFNNDSDEHEQYSTIKRSPKSPNDVNTENMKNSEANTVQQETVIERVAQGDQKQNKLPPIVTEQQIVDEVVYQGLGEDLGLRARALYDYQAADDTEITFDPGDIITHIDQIDEGWWQGLGPDGTFGLFPANYVELIF